MWTLIKKVIKDCLTGVNGDCYDFAKVSGMFGIQCLLGMEIWHLYDDNVFNAVEFATAFGTILAASCGGVWLKSKGNDMPTVAPPPVGSK